jgi:hypothetical protein
VEHRDPPPLDGEEATEATGSSDSLAFLRAVARVPEVVPDAVDESGSHLAAGEDPPRFALRRRLGSGGFGTVYEAHDRRRDAAVALKILRRTDAHALYLFKQEFRALAGIVHPHLVRLYELYEDERRWFFTMELCAGTSLVAHLRAAPDEARLRACFSQLAEGLAFLHEAGKLHRDVKPSNVMADAAGRVKLLDFGLVIDLADTSPAGRVGTPSYMAPEQAEGRAVGPAADLYAVGVMLHEALTGKLPARGGDGSPRAIDAAIPEDLDRLCRDLLAPDPTHRPSAAEVIARLGGGVTPSHRLPPPAPFVGRAAELDLLRAALADARAGRASVALVHGTSGMGKSALLQRFVEEAGDALVLSGRCFQQESVPYKALDSVIDALGRHLLFASAEEIRALLPDDAGALGTLFPVLRQVPAIAAAAAKRRPDDHRHSAFAALRELLVRLSGARAVVIAVDDLQWGDLDSVALLAEILRPPSPPPLLVVAAYRAEDALTSPVVTGLAAALRAEVAPGVAVREIAVGELLPAEGEALARALLGDQAGASACARIADEAHRSPFFIRELSRWAAEGDRPDGADLSALLGARIARLPEAARRVLEVIAVAGQPIARAAAARAAQAAGGAFDEPEALSQLLAAQLVRVQAGPLREDLAPYHDRIREAALAALPPERRRAESLALARALEATGGAEPSLLVHCLREAGRPAEAAAYALAAAGQARAALAFDRAARFFREALALGGLDPEAERGARGDLATALALAGRPREAAEACLDLAAREAPAAALDLRRRAATLLLAGGYLDEGVAAIDDVLADLGMKRPSSTAAAVAEVAAHRARLAVRGLDTRERAEPEVPERLLREIDACHAVASSLGIALPFHVGPFQTRQLLLALDAGEPFRLGRALLMEAINVGLRGGVRAGPASAALLQRAEPLLRKAGRPETQGMVELTQGIVAFMTGEPERAEPLLRACIADLSEHRAEGGSGQELAYALLVTLLWVMGRIPELSATSDALLADARERGNLYRATMIRLNGAYHVDLASDRPDAARAAVRAAMEGWPRGVQHIQHLRATFARSHIALYEGDGREAFRLMTSALRPLVGSGMITLRALRAEFHHHRALAALAAAARGGPGAPALRALALLDARALERGRVRWGAGVAGMMRASVAAQRGRVEEAARTIAAAEETLAQGGFALYAAAARRVRGAWIGGDAGRDLVTAADAWMRERGVVRPARLTAILAG